MLSFAKRTLLFYSPLLLCLSLGTVQAKPNVLWLLVEGLETKALNPGGLPALVSLAEKGVVFNRAYGASPSSNASRTAMMTGQLPSSNGVWSDGDDPRRSLALEGRRTAPEQFKKMGWLTLAAGEIFHATAGGADQRMGDRRGYEVDAAWDERFPGDGVQRPQEPADPVPTFDVPAEAGETEVAAKAGVTKSGNAQIAETMFRYFRWPERFDDFVWLSQIQQGLAIKTAVTHWRGLKPHCMGTLYWQLNDTWPVASWSSLDYGGGWKLLHHMARAFYAPVTVVAVPGATIAFGGGGPHCITQQIPVDVELPG